MNTQTVGTQQCSLVCPYKYHVQSTGFDIKDVNKILGILANGLYQS